MTCENCGATLAPGDSFCGSCGHRAGQGTSSPTLSALPYTAPTAYPPPSPPGGYPSEPVARRNLAVPLLAAAVVFVLAAGGVGAWWLLGRDPEPSTAAVATATPTPSAPDAPTPPSTPATSAPATSAAPRATGAAPRETVYVQPRETVYVQPREREAAPAPAAPPAGGDQWAGLRGTWITVLDSIPQSSMSRASARERAAQIPRSAGAPAPFVLDSTHTPGLNSGYWAIVTGHYPSKSAAQGMCASFYRSVGGSCYGRQISDG